MINDKLKALYRANLDGFRHRMERNDQTDIGLDGPWLMYCHEEYYLAADKKILFVGKEGSTPAGWTTDDIDGQIEGHRKFAFSANRENNDPIYKSPRTPFWLAVWEMNNKLNPSLVDRPCFLHSNVCRYSLDGGPISPEDYGWIHEIANLLPQEVKVVEPDVVIFFSGPYFDEYIRSQFGGEITLEHATIYIDKWQLARVIHPNLPHNTFRTYHPRALRKDKWHFIDLIASLVTGYDPEALIKKLQTEMETVARDLEMKMSCFQGESVVGSADSCFCFFRSAWPYFAIGFGFDIAIGEFFYGICGRGLNAQIPEDAVTCLLAKLADPDGEGTANWPWWKWHTRIWGIDTYQSIQSGDFAKNLKDCILQLEDRIRDVVG